MEYTLFSGNLSKWYITILCNGDYDDYDDSNDNDVVKYSIKTYPFAQKSHEVTHT